MEQAKRRIRICLICVVAAAVLLGLLLRHVTASFGFRGEWDAGKQPDGRRRK